MNQLELTQKRLAGVLQKRPGFALAIVGPPGIGKTFTVAKLLLQTPCAQQRFHAGIGPGELLKSLLRPRKTSSWVTGTLEQVTAGVFVELPLLVAALTAIMSGLAPFVLHLEDVHETDADQLEFVLALAQAIKGVKGAALLVTSRTVVPEPFEVVPLEPLPSEAVRALLESEMGASLPTECLALIDARAAGNPLFALEFFRFLTRRGFVWNDGSRWHWRAPEQDVLPATVEAVIERVIAETCVQPEVRCTLEARAFLETVLPNQKLEVLEIACVADLEPDAVVQAERHLLTRGVFNAHGFAHPLFREVPVKNVSPQLRETLARRAMSCLKDPALIAQFIPDANLERDQARDVLRIAMTHAEASGQRQVIYDLTCIALDLEVFDVAEQVRLGLRVAQHNLTKAAALYARIEADLLEIECLDDVYGWANVLAQLGRLSDALKLLQALPVGEHDQSRWLEESVMVHATALDFVGAVGLWDAHDFQACERSEVLLGVAQSLMQVGRLPEVRTVLERALNAAQDESVLADVLMGKGRFLSFVGPANLSDETYVQAYTIYERLENAQGMAAALHGRGILKYYEGGYGTAVEHFSRAKHHFWEAGNQTRFVQSLTMLCATQTELALYEQAERGLLEAEELLRGTNGVVLVDVCTNLSFLYRGWHVTFGPMLALKYARLGLRVAQELNNPRLKANCLYHLSKSETLNNNPGLGLQLADETLDLAAHLQYPGMLAYPHHARFQALLALNRLPEALEALRTAERRVRLEDCSADADFYALELECLQENWEAARERMAQMQAYGSVHFSQVALRLYPQLEVQTGHEKVTDARAPHLLVLGEMQIFIDCRGESVRGRKRQELLAFLLEARIAGRKEVHRLELLDAVYPEGYEAQNASSLKQLIHSVRAEYGPNVILTSSNGYALGQVGSDAEDFLHNNDAQNWRGPYLESIRTASDNTQVSETLHLALFAQAKTQLETNPPSALSASEILLGFDAFNLEHLELHLRALQANGQQKSLTRAYKKSCKRLLEIGETLPETWQAFLSVRDGFAQKKP